MLRWLCHWISGSPTTQLECYCRFLQGLPWDLVALVTAQYVERVPRAPELLSRGVHEATGTFDIGNPNLKIEGAESVEAGLRRAVGPFRFEATAYYTRFYDFIFRQLTGETCGSEFQSCTPVGPGGELIRPSGPSAMRSSAAPNPGAVRCDTVVDRDVRHRRPI